MTRLDDAYANAAHIPDGSGYPELWSERAREFREIEAICGRARLNQPFGDGLAYDLFTPSARPQGTLIFIHGGYWKAFGRKDWSHLAVGSMARGWAVAIPSYPLAPDASIPDITQSVRHGVEVLADVTQGPISLVGHSAGGHLVARMAMADVGLRTDVMARISAIVPMSPVGDLTDLKETSMWEELGLTDQVAHMESPTLGQPEISAGMSVWVGQDERPKFIEQAQALSDAWSIDCVIKTGRHHFDIIDELCDPDSAVVSFLTKS